MPSRNTGERRNSQLLMSSGVTPLSSPEGRRGGGGRVGGWILRKQVFEGLQLREEREREGERIEEEGGRAGEGEQGRERGQGKGGKGCCVGMSYLSCFYSLCLTLKPKPFSVSHPLLLNASSPLITRTLSSPPAAIFTPPFHLSSIFFILFKEIVLLLGVLIFCFY